MGVGTGLQVQSAVHQTCYLTSPGPITHSFEPEFCQITFMEIGHENFYGHSLPTADSSGAVLSYWLKYMHLVLVNCLGGLSLLRNSVSRLADLLNITLIVLTRS